MTRPAILVAMPSPRPALTDSSPRTTDRERPATPGLTTLTRLCLAAALALAAACGGGKTRHADRYAAATNLQQQCCEKAPDRDACLGDIVRAPDADIATAPANQATFACVQENFECDAATGRATPASTQAQFDCIQDLPQQ
jgi:hypothetical protein